MTQVMLENALSRIDWFDCNQVEKGQSPVLHDTFSWTHTATVLSNPGACVERTGAALFVQEGMGERGADLYNPVI